MGVASEESEGTERGSAVSESSDEVTEPSSGAIWWIFIRFRSFPRARSTYPSSTTASASISMSMSGWIRRVTSTRVVVGGCSPKTSLWASP